MRKANQRIPLFLTSGFEAFIKRILFLYIVVAIVLLIVVNREVTYINYLNLLKSIEGDLQEFIRGRKVLDQESIHQGVQYFEEVLRENKEDPASLGGLGLCYFLSKDYTRAVEFYRQAINIDHNLYSYSWDSGMIYFQTGEYRQAIPYLQKAIDQIPMTVSFLLRLVERFQEKGKGKMTALVYPLVNRAQIDEVQAYIKLIQCYYFLKEFAMMREMTLVSLQIQPHNVEFIYLAGLANFMLERNRQAISYFNQAIELDDNNIGAYYHRGHAWQKLNQYDKYISDLRKVPASYSWGSEDKRFKEENIMLHLNTDIHALVFYAQQK